MLVAKTTMESSECQSRLVVMVSRIGLLSSWAVVISCRGGLVTVQLELSFHEFYCHSVGI